MSSTLRQTSVGSESQWIFKFSEFLYKKQKDAMCDAPSLGDECPDSECFEFEYCLDFVIVTDCFNAMHPKLVDVCIEVVDHWNGKRFKRYPIISVARGVDDQAQIRSAMRALNGHPNNKGERR